MRFAHCTSAFKWTIIEKSSLKAMESKRDSEQVISNEVHRCSTVLNRRLHSLTILSVRYAAFGFKLSSTFKFSTVACLNTICCNCSVVTPYNDKV
jgi:hypothetical protein